MERMVIRTMGKISASQAQTFAISRGCWRAFEGPKAFRFENRQPREGPTGRNVGACHPKFRVQMFKVQKVQAEWLTGQIVS